MNSSQALLTIVVPVYNRAGVVQCALDSIAEQTLRPLSLIIVDNNSTDSSRAVIERWADARRSSSFDIKILSETTPGAAAARNCGLHAVTTPYVMFFDSDDTMHPQLAQQVVDAFEHTSQPDIVAWGVDMVKPQGGIKYHRAIDKRPARVMFDALVHGRLSTQRYAVRTRLIYKVGGWDPSVRVWDDMELSVRLLLQHPVIETIGLPHAVTIACSADSITASTELVGADERCEHALNCCEHSLIESQCYDQLRWVDYRRVILAADYARRGAHDDARRLLSNVCYIAPLLARFMYYKHRFYRRGTYVLMHIN